MGLRIGNALKNTFLRLRRYIVGGLRIRLGTFTIILDTSLWLLTPVSVWAIATIYVPIMGTGFSSFQTWMVSLAILILMFLSVFLHSFAHLAIACRASPQRIFLSPLGDPAHFWWAAPDAGKEFLAAIVGPLTQCLLAALFYVL